VHTNDCYSRKARIYIVERNRNTTHRILCPGQHVQRKYRQRKYRQRKKYTTVCHVIILYYARNFEIVLCQYFTCRHFAFDICLCRHLSCRHFACRHFDTSPANALQNIAIIHNMLVKQLSQDHQEKVKRDLTL
jgi:hypothetical protein